MVYLNASIDLGVDALIDTLEAQIEKILDMFEVSAGSSFQSYQRLTFGQRRYGGPFLVKSCYVGTVQQAPPS